jgi:DNA-directed RNA polymerase specialized sigma24 family protein
MPENKIEKLFEHYMNVALKHVGEHGGEINDVYQEVLENQWMTDGINSSEYKELKKKTI